MSGKYEKYLHLTQAAKSASIASVAYISNAMLALPIHPGLRFLILEPLIISLVI